MPDTLDTLAWTILAALDDLRVTDLATLTCIVARDRAEVVAALDLLDGLGLIQEDVAPTALGVLPQEAAADHVITTTVAGDTMLRQRWAAID